MVVMFGSSLFGGPPAVWSTYHTLRALNAWSPLESADAHGPLGFQVGLGASRVMVPQDAQGPLSSALQRSRVDSVVMPKLFLTKGLWNPVDIGLLYGELGAHSARQLAGYVQWTVWGAATPPTFAMRVLYSRLYGLENGVMETGGISAVASLRLPFFRPFAEVGVYNNRASLVFTDSNLTEPLNPEKNWWQPEVGMGFLLTIVPMVVEVGLEVLSGVAPQSTPVYQGKISVGL